MEEKDKKSVSEEKEFIDNPEVKEKVKKNVLYISIFSIVMLFAGLTSAYIVVQKDNFWVVLNMPNSFWISTLLIVLSSFTIYWSLIAAKKNQLSNVKTALGLTLVLGLGFSYFQFKGWGDLIERGSYFTSNIVNNNGKYGKFFTIYHDGQEIIYDNYQFFKGAEVISDDLKSQMKGLAKGLSDGSKKKYDLDQYYGDFVLYYEDQLLTYTNNRLYLDEELNNLQTVQLERFAENIVNDRGDFFLKGEYGNDFYLTYRGQKVEYANREFYLNGQKLSAAQYDKLRDSRNTASSFIYIFSFLHWLHLVGGIIYLLTLFRRSLKKELNAENHLKLKLGNIYWHFLGGLWIYLFLFLNFIN